MAYVWPKLATNGPAEVGISAAKSDAHDPTYALQVFPSPLATAVKSYCDPQWPKDVSRHTRVVAFLAAKRAWFGPLKNGKGMANVIINPKDPDRDANEEKIEDEVRKDLDKPDFVSASTLPTFMAQVSAWLTNHRVGQGELNPLMKKIYKIDSWGGDDRSFRSAVWVVSHWIDTIACWKAWGIPDLIDPDYMAIPDIPKASRDIEIRMQSFPAGAMKLQVAMALIQRIASTIMVRVFPPLLDYLDILRLALEVKAHPALYHVGAGYHSGKSPLPITSPSDESFRHLAAFIHATAPDSTLARAKVLPRLEEVKNDTVYITCSRVVASFAMKALSDDDIKDIFGDIKTSGDQFRSIDVIMEALSGPPRLQDDLIKQVTAQQAAATASAPAGANPPAQVVPAVAAAPSPVTSASSSSAPNAPASSAAAAAAAPSLPQRQPRAPAFVRPAPPPSGTKP